MVLWVAYVLLLLLNSTLIGVYMLVSEWFSAIVLLQCGALCCESYL